MTRIILIRVATNAKPTLVIHRAYDLAKDDAGHRFGKFLASQHVGLICPEAQKQIIADAELLWLQDVVDLFFALDESYKTDQSATLCGEQIYQRLGSRIAHQMTLVAVVSREVNKPYGEVDHTVLHDSFALATKWQQHY